MHLSYLLGSIIALIMLVFIVRRYIKRSNEKLEDEITDIKYQLIKMQVAIEVLQEVKKWKQPFQHEHPVWLYCGETDADLR